MQKLVVPPHPLHNLLLPIYVSTNEFSFITLITSNIMQILLLQKQKKNFGDLLHYNTFHLSLLLVD